MTDAVLVVGDAATALDLDLVEQRVPVADTLEGADLAPQGVGVGANDSGHLDMGHGRSPFRLGNDRGRAMAAPTIYGIRNCDTMKKARAWLDGKGVAYAFHDYKTAGIDRARLEGWAGKVGWETLLNRSGTTFRKLPETDKAGLGERKAIALMLAQPSMIKRPVLELSGGKLLVGFKEADYLKSLNIR